ncbi:hypothetical protein V6N11_018495 [Hibiscus sabdariffa]|uniref:TOD1/MUCI70 glycosyltransferase-like domain-containing protein n=1 Tax=Hibiscus sabdariffa TaxID=183260 RepID=A0ABR2T7K5_9ROSI
MTAGSLGIRSGSYGSLDKQLQNGVLPIQSASAARTKPSSKVFKEKETLIHWICKFTGRKKVRMLLLCLISAAVFVWVLYVGKGEYQESDDVDKVNNNLPVNNSDSPQINQVQRDFDIIQQPKNISEYSKQTICFYMFVDEETQADLKNKYENENNKMERRNFVVQKYHKEVLACLAPPPPPPPPPQYSGNDPSKVFSGESGSVAARKVSPRRRRDRRSGSRHHRKVSREMVVSQIKN